MSFWVRKAGQGTEGEGTMRFALSCFDQTVTGVKTNQLGRRLAFSKQRQSRPLLLFPELCAKGFYGMKFTFY